MLFEFDQNYRMKFPLLAGVDEAGRGAWAGPVVAAAVILDPQKSLEGVNDSKKLTPKKVESLKALPFTISGDNGETDIRAIARSLPSGEGTVVISVALDSVDKTVAGLRGIFILISFIVLISIAIVARSLIKLTLKPLNQIEKTAAAIADGDLSARLPQVNSKTEPWG